MIIDVAFSARRIQRGKIRCVLRCAVFDVLFRVVGNNTVGKKVSIHTILFRFNTNMIFKHFGKMT